LEVRMSAPSLGYRERAAVSRVLRSGQLSMGPKVAEFESAVSRFQGLGLGVAAVNSGTSALHLGLLAMNLTADDEVIVPAFTFAATANAVLMAGAKPVFADVDLDTMNLSSDTVAASLSSKTRAVIFVSLYGNLSGISSVVELCKQRGLDLIEDAAQSLGGSEGGVSSGGFGRWGAYSFYPTKHVTAGEGGAVISGDESFLHRVRLLRNQGMSALYDNEIPGLNNRMTDIAASIGIEQMSRAKAFLKRRREIAHLYSNSFQDLTGVVYQRVAENNAPSYNQFTLRVGAKRDRLQTELSLSGIQTRVYYPTPVSDLRPFKHLSSKVPNSRKLSQEVISIPIHPELTDRQVRYVCRKVREKIQELD